MSQQWRMLFLAVLVSLSLACCRSYTRSLTHGREVTPNFLSTVLEPGDTYKVKLNNHSEYKIKVTSIARDSLYGSFYFMSGNRMRKTESRVLLNDIIEVKEARIDIIKTALVIVVPVAVGAIIVSQITFSGMSF